MREPDAGIAGRAFDDRAARLEAAAALGVVDDGTRRAILHRAAGIHEFGLAENLAAGLVAETIQADQRRIADRIREAARMFCFWMLMR